MRDESDTSPPDTKRKVSFADVVKDNPDIVRGKIVSTK